MYVQKPDLSFQTRPNYKTINYYLESKRPHKSKNNILEKQNYSTTIISPYVAQLERHKKMRSVAARQKSRRQHQQRRQLSSKKFRIQQLNYSLKARNKSNERNQKVSQQKKQRIGMNSNNQTNPKQNNKKHNKNQEKQIQIINQQQKTHNSKQQKKQNSDFNDLYTKLKSKRQQNKLENYFRRKKYIDSSLEQKDNTIIQHGHDVQSKHQNSFRKIAYTQNNIVKKLQQDQQKQVQKEKKEVVHKNEKKNFRKNKYEVIHSQTIQQKSHQKNQKDQVNYISVDIQKKESNSSLIRQLHLQTQKEIELQQKILKPKMNKIYQKSLEKSTEEYFKQDLRIKSRNQIQIYISTVKNPSINRCSQASTLNVSDKRQKNETFLSTMKSNKDEIILYDFQIENTASPRFVNIQQEQSSSKNKQIQSQSEQEKESEEQNPLQKFKKQQKKILNNGDLVKISWSQDQIDCKIADGQLQYS